MERDLYTGDFERMLKQKADEYRMYPSEKAWAHINRSLHRSRKHYYIKIASLTTALMLSISLFTSRFQDRYLPFEPVTETQMTKMAEAKIVAEAPAVHAMLNKQFPAEPEQNHVATINTAAVAEATVQMNDEEILPAETAANAAQDPSIKRSAEYITITATDKQLKGEMAPMPDLSALTKATPFMGPKSVPANEMELADFNKTDAELNYEVRIPVVNRPTNKEIVYHFTPSMSYRVLQTPTSFTFGNLVPQDPDNAVKHSPALGLEAGISVLTPISEGVKFISGLQFNYTSYQVAAYTSFPQMTTVRLSGFNNVQRVSNLRTSGGSMVKQQLLNTTFQVSVPLGFQFRITGNNQFSWNVNSTLQPSYLLGATGYLVTSDYNNYIKAPEFLRRFNMNTGIETFLTWKKGNTIWQAGPALRYQLFSNSVSAYPIREHLLNYGFRLGMIKRF